MSQPYTKQDQLKKNKPKKLRKKKCKICKEWFDREREAQRTCGKIECAIEDGKIMNKKHQEQTKRAFKQNEKSKLRENAQKAFNAYIRERDKNLPCVSCGHTGNRKWNAGHFKSVGQNPQLRFNELNVHKQCELCNCHKSGNLAEYRINLIKKIGIENVEALESDKSTKKYTEDDYKNIIVKYRHKLKELQNKE